MTGEARHRTPPRPPPRATPGPLPTAPMADLLLGVEQAMRGKDAKVRGGDAWTELLSSHPDTPRRARDLKDGHAHGCR